MYIYIYISLWLFSMVQPSIPQHLRRFRLRVQLCHLQHLPEHRVGQEKVGPKKGLRRQLQLQALGMQKRQAAPGPL